MARPASQSAQTRADLRRRRPLDKRSPGIDYAEFWSRYLAAHADPRTRALHYLGTVCATAMLVMAALGRDWRWLIAVPVAGYAPAWVGHLVFEHNRPETFGHPVWSLASDLRMLRLFATGGLAAELRRAGVADRG